ncbi:MAG: GreA/GreB family elongation factor [Bacilli bacterium]|nr:GreA/GreB family elongation factor [Bacilli bacterium]
MKEKLRMDLKGYQEYLAEIIKLEKQLNDLRKYKGTDAIYQGDNWHDNPTLYQVESQERSLMFRIKEMKEKALEIEIIEKTANDELIDVGDTVVIDMIFAPDDQEEQTFTLIGGNPDFELDIPQISINSPLGASIYHKKIGDQTSYTVEQRIINIFIKQKSNLKMEENNKYKKMK